MGSPALVDGLIFLRIKSCLLSVVMALWGLSPNIRWTPRHHGRAGRCCSQHDAVASQDSFAAVTSFQCNLSSRLLREWEGIRGRPVNSDVLSPMPITLHGWTVTCWGSFHRHWSGYWFDRPSLVLPGSPWVPASLLRHPLQTAPGHIKPLGCLYLCHPEGAAWPEHLIWLQAQTTENWK